jgi:hypothetical protein
MQASFVHLSFIVRIILTVNPGVGVGYNQLKQSYKEEIAELI